MKLQTWRLPPLLLVLFLSTIILAQEQVSDTRRRDQQPIGNSEQLSNSDSHSHNDGDFGQSAFEEATTLLLKFRPSLKKQSSYRKPTGLIGTTTHYAKELFFLLFMNSPTERDLIASRPQKKLSPPLAQAVKLLEEAANKENYDAMYLLAQMNFHGNYTHPRNYPEAFRWYDRLASETGNSSAQHMLGFMYATGIGGATEADQAKALLYHTFAAEHGDIRSQMTVAFRHHAGISTPRNCEQAVYYYQRVADEAIEHMKSGPPGGFTLVKESYRIADEEGGVYGEGASVSSSGPNARTGGPNSDAYADPEDVLDYIDLMHRTGEPRATFKLAKTYYDGARGFKPNYQMAKKYFLDVTRLYWKKDGKARSDIGPGIEKLASNAAGFLGRMFLRGEGVEQRFDIAQAWFKRGVANGDALCQYHLGLMYLHGYGVPQDAVKAAEYFAPAADQDLAAAQVKLGALFLDQGDVPIATKYFDLAARNGHIEAYYYLAELAHQGVGREKSCGVATVYYKIVAEKAEAMLSSFEEANEAYEADDLQTALVGYMMGAEQGFEVGQANVAFLLDRAMPGWSWYSLLCWGKNKTTGMMDDALALIYWTRSAKQLNIDSMVKMGDYYLEGRGTTLDQEKAATCYQAAAETMQCAQAMWNLGWMHENGLGVEQDFHLAKRFYDMALETNPTEAYVPVMLALYKLRLRSWWNDVTDGRVKSIQDEPEPKKEWSLSEWINNFLEAGEAYYDDAYDTEDGWNSQGAGDMPGGDDYYDEIDEGILDTLIILSLAGVLAYLIYYRNRRRQAEEQRQQHQRANQPGGAQGEDRGVLPARDDPEFMNWQAGGVGH